MVFYPAGYDKALERTLLLVKERQGRDSSGHDHLHSERVWKLARAIAHEQPSAEVDIVVVEMAALLHDISDYKLNGGDLERGPAEAESWVRELGLGQAVAMRVAHVIETIGFRGANVIGPSLSSEAEIVQDADRLDAIGAIGIARAFAFGGAHGQTLIGRTLSPILHTSFEGYKDKSRGTTVEHFYEKLLLLRERMNTEPAKRMAERRHKFMVEFLKQLQTETDGEFIDMEEDFIY
ncbi:MAG: HD domain-containing protein [Burkholderiaceae bacterium]